MSHFVVLVVGPDPEAQLQPYHEFECTGTIDQYVQSVDILEEARASWEPGESYPTLESYLVGYYSLPLAVEDFPPDLEDDNMFGWYRLNGKGDVIEAFQRTNPNFYTVTYINCSAAVKALSDVICTSGNAVKIVNGMTAMNQAVTP